jgi:hypothetical protein
MAVSAGGMVCSNILLRGTGMGRGGYLGGSSLIRTGSLSSGTRGGSNKSATNWGASLPKSKGHSAPLKRKPKKNVPKSRPKPDAIPVSANVSAKARFITFAAYRNAIRKDARLAQSQGLATASIPPEPQLGSRPKGPRTMRE